MDKISQANPFWQKNILFVIALVISVAVTWRIINQVNHNHQLEQQAAEKRARIKLLDQQKKNQILNNEFFRSNYYLDLAIREQQGYTLPGESILVIDEQKIAQIKEVYQPQTVIEETPPPSLSNLEKWRNFIFDVENLD